MSATITIGAWAIPLTITLVSMGWALTRPIKHGDYSFDIMPVLWGFCAIILSLLSWLVWAVLT